MDPPAFRQLREQQERLRDIMDPPAFRQLKEQQERLQALFDSPSFTSLREEADRWDELLAPEVVAEVGEFQADLAARVNAAAERTQPEIGEGGQAATVENMGTVWFGAASWAVLVAEIQGLLKALEVIASVLSGRKTPLDAQERAAVLALVVMSMSATEFAVRLAKQGVNT